MEEITKEENIGPNVHPKVLIIEPFYGGSHKQLLTTILSDATVIATKEVSLFTLPAKKWHWRARTSALNFSQTIPIEHSYKVLFCSGTLNLCELIGLRPDLSCLRKVIYFHENQLVYPVRENKDRDFQYGYNQITSCLSADTVVFNSQFNLNSFLEAIPTFLNLQKDERPNKSKIVSSIRDKSRVLFFPIEVSPLPKPDAEDKFLHILWPHRWEHDKNPEAFFSVLSDLVSAGHDFRVSVLGEHFSEVPYIFEEAKVKLEKHIVNWGHVESREDYLSVLTTCDVVVSTALHEFFGVAMVEATLSGCYPLCPNRLVYPEIYPKECLYNTNKQLYKRLATFCSKPYLAKTAGEIIQADKYKWKTVKKQYEELLKC